MNTHQAKLKRMAGMSPQRKAYVNQRLSQAQDWQINCQSCGQRMVGSLEWIDKHREECGGKESN